MSRKRDNGGCVLFCILEAVYLPLAHHWGFWYGKLDAVIYASFILIAKIIWHLIDYGISAKTASEINEKIRKRRLEQLNDTRYMEAFQNDFLTFSKMRI